MCLFCVFVSTWELFASLVCWQFAPFLHLCKTKVYANKNSSKAGSEKVARKVYDAEKCKYFMLRKVRHAANTGHAQS